ncbi:hypothetical protein D9613_003691 [Agrocybe pediades]|uniref:Uncharacterized protein n=1 Tax=Agrocybe pediades TaxID=84607 RepID=A0A8H4VLA5_9AGAR|nr:hypothetical protein D9613_003691 [Agrocybe pediades]
MDHEEPATRTLKNRAENPSHPADLSLSPSFTYTPSSLPYTSEFATLTHYSPTTASTPIILILILILILIAYLHLSSF